MNQITNLPKLMSSVEIADLTEKRHGDVMRDIRTMHEQLGQSISASAYVDAQGKERRQYMLDQNMTLTLVSGYNVVLRKRIIDRWHELESSAKPILPDFTDPVASARAWADAKEAEQKALAVIAEQAPKVAVYELLADRKGDVSTTVMAKQLGVSAIKLNQFLRDIGAKWQNADLPKAGHMDWFNVVALDVGGNARSQCLITPKGQIEIAKRWEKSAAV